MPHTSTPCPPPHRHPRNWGFHYGAILPGRSNSRIICKAFEYRMSCLHSLRGNVVTFFVFHSPPVSLRFHLPACIRNCPKICCFPEFSRAFPRQHSNIPFSLLLFAICKERMFLNGISDEAGGRRVRLRRNKQNYLLFPMLSQPEKRTRRHGFLFPKVKPKSIQLDEIIKTIVITCADADHSWIFFSTGFRQMKKKNGRRIKRKIIFLDVNSISFSN